MKLTSVTFAAAFVLLMAGLASQQAPQRSDLKQTLALDFTGIHTLRVESGNGARIEISSAAPTVVYTEKPGAVVTAKRDGDTLFLETKNFDYPLPEITIPATVRVLETQSVDVEALVALTSLSIHAEGPVTWAGDAGSLSIHALPGRNKCGQAYCGSGVTINGGNINDLSIAVPSGDVRLNSDSQGRTTLRLGPEATFSLIRIKRVRDLQILPYDAATPADASTPEPTKISP